jgi:multisubunit Na+/H+ antiporter MnhB subunit
MCGTCDFALPGGVHICPTCAAAPKTDLSPRRKAMMITSFVMAGISTFGIAIIFSGALAAMSDKSAAAGLALLLFLGVLVCSVVGTALGFSAMDRRLPTPMALWITAIWNAVILACHLLRILFHVVG